jgi:hypothetical protein
MQHGEHQGIGEYPPSEQESVQPVEPLPEEYEASIYQPSHYYRPAKRVSVPPGLGKAALFLGLAALVAGAGWLVVGGVLGAHERPEKPARADAFAPELPPGFDTTRAVALCDLNMQRQVAARSSYKGDWGWKIVADGDLVSIRRGFSAKNLHGVELHSEYTCVVSAVNGRIFALQFSGAGREVTLGAGELSQ